MKALFERGPYDGVELDHNDINLYTTFYPIGHRQFVLMPPLDQWDAIRRGDKSKHDQFEKLFPYELIRSPESIRAVFDDNGGLDRALIDERDGRATPQIPTVPTGKYYLCIQGTWCRAAADQFTVTDEKGRIWTCQEISRVEAERADVFHNVSELAREHAISKTSESLSWGIEHCEAPFQLAARLANIID